MRASPTAELVFEDVEVPAANLVGELGGATLCMMRNLEIERVVLAAMSVGIARRCLQAMNTYATERTAFGQKLPPSARCSGTRRVVCRVQRARPTCTRRRSTLTLTRRPAARHRRRQAVPHDDGQKRGRPGDPGDGRGTATWAERTA